MQDYAAALELAVDGMRHAGAGPQSVRLAVNGAARAMGKLGDVQGVHRMVGETQESLSRQEVAPGIVSSIGFGCYSEAQVASNAATAYVSLGMPERARYHLDRALPDITASRSPWSRALVTIDLATALAQSKEADLEKACGLVLEALAVAAGRPVSRSSSVPGSSSAMRWGVGVGSASLTPYGTPWHVRGKPMPDPAGAAGARSAAGGGAADCFRRLDRLHNHIGLDRVNAVPGSGI